MTRLRGRALSAEPADGPLSLDLTLCSDRRRLRHLGRFPLRLAGVGGGFVLVPALSRFSDLPMRSIAATSLAVIGLVSVSGVLSAALTGGIQWAVALPFSAGAVLGMFAGRTVSLAWTGACCSGASVGRGCCRVGLLLQVAF